MKQCITNLAKSSLTSSTYDCADATMYSVGARSDTALDTLDVSVLPSSSAAHVSASTTSVAWIKLSRTCASAWADATDLYDPSFSAILLRALA